MYMGTWHVAVASALRGLNLISFSGLFPRIRSSWLCLELTIGARTWLVAMQPPLLSIGVAVGYYRASPLPLFCMGYIDHASEGMHEYLYALGGPIFHSR